jgi:translation initiation factor IF-2
MSELNKIRLNKVIREFNISLERVVEFLSSKGHEIEARPTTKISQSQYDLLLAEFKSDRSSRVESHDLIEEKNKEKEELRIKFEKEQEQKAQSSTITSKSSFHKFKKVGEIDLNPIKEISTKNEDSVISDEKTVESTTEKDSKIQTKYEKLSGLKKTGEKN